jgi:hypothetical protein
LDDTSGGHCIFYNPVSRRRAVVPSHNRDVPKGTLMSLLREAGFTREDRDIILCVLGGRTNEQWISQYGSSHQHPVNRVCHTLGIPTILLSVPLFVASIFFYRLWLYALALFLIGWVFQFIGHAFEGKPPEFFHDWRFLFVGVRWWWAKIHGKA